MINLALFALLAVGGGLGSAWYMIEAGSRLSTRSSGPWMTWSASGRPDADPYTRAHTVRNGLLPLASTLEITYQAKADSRGGRLQSGCEYAIVMEGLDGGAWWSLAAFDGQGRLIQNPAERYAFSNASHAWVWYAGATAPGSAAGSLNFNYLVPVTVGGKLRDTGAVAFPTPDQFNGQVDNVLLTEP